MCVRYFQILTNLKNVIRGTEEEGLNLYIQKLYMRKLGLIITGQLRTFFSDRVHTSFVKWLTILNKEYSLYIICVVNEKEVNIEQFTFLSEISIMYSIIPFTQKVKYPTSSFYNFIEKEERRLGIFQERKGEAEFLQILSKQFFIQKAQLSLGFQELYKILGDSAVYIKTRFDIVYSEEIPIVPFSNPNSLFAHSALLEKSHGDICGQIGIEDYFEYISKRANYKGLRIPSELRPISFGGQYSLMTKMPASQEKLWLYNDYIIIGEGSTFKKYVESNSLIDNPELLLRISKENHIRFFLAPEAYMLSCIYSLGIQPIMYYREDLYYILRAGQFKQT